MTACKEEGETASTSEQEDKDDCFLEHKLSRRHQRAALSLHPKPSACLLQSALAVLMSLILHERDIFPFMPALVSLLSSYLVPMRLLGRIRFTRWADARQFFGKKRREFSKAHTRAPFCVVYCLTSSRRFTMKGLYHGVPTHRCVSLDAMGVF